MYDMMQQDNLIVAGNKMLKGKSKEWRRKSPIDSRHSC